MLPVRPFAERLQETLRARREAYRREHPDEASWATAADEAKDCPACGGAGVVLQAFLIASCPTCRPPKIVTGPTMEDFHIPSGYSQTAERALTIARDLAQAMISTGGPPWVVFYGQNGAGKTFLARAIAGGRQRLGEPAQLWRAEELIEWLRETQAPQDDLPQDQRVRLSDRLAFLRKLRWLVIDELGKERQTPWAIEQLEAIINRRYVDKSGLIITTNFSPLALDSPLSAAVKSRLGDRSLCEIVNMTDVPDYRARLRR